MLRLWCFCNTADAKEKKKAERQAAREAYEARKAAAEEKDEEFDEEPPEDEPEEEPGEEDAGEEGEDADATELKPKKPTLEEMTAILARLELRPEDAVDTATKAAEECDTAAEHETHRFEPSECLTSCCSQV